MSWDVCQRDGNLRNKILFQVKISPQHLRQEEDTLLMWQIFISDTSSRCNKYTDGILSTRRTNGRSPVQKKKKKRADKKQHRAMPRLLEKWSLTAPCRQTFVKTPFDYRDSSEVVEVLFVEEAWYCIKSSAREYCINVWPSWRSLFEIQH